MKRLESYTLGEIKEICNRETCVDCPLRSWCCDYGEAQPCDWSFTNWTDQDIEDARAIKIVIPGAASVFRTEANELYVTDDFGERQLPMNLLPSLDIGETVLLDDIVNE